MQIRESKNEGMEQDLEDWNDGQEKPISSAALGASDRRPGSVELSVSDSVSRGDLLYHTQTQPL